MTLARDREVRGDLGRQAGDVDDRLLQVVPEGQGYTWKSSPYEGLRRYGGGTPGGGHQVQYLTFRTITPDSPGWFIPPVAGQHFPERVVAAVGPKIADMVAEALSADLHGRFVAQMNEAGVFTVTRG